MVPGCEVARRSWLCFGVMFLFVVGLVQHSAEAIFQEDSEEERVPVQKHLNTPDFAARIEVEDEDDEDEEYELIGTQDPKVEDSGDLYLDLILDEDPCQETDEVTQHYLRRAIHMLDMYFNMIQVSTKDKLRKAERPARTQEDGDDQIWLDDLKDFIRSSLEVSVNTYEYHICVHLKQPRGCRKFHMKAAAVHELYEFARERHQVPEEVLTKRIFMEMAFYPYDASQAAKRRLTQRFREMLFFLVYPSVSFELYDVDTWGNITLGKWEAFQGVHDMPSEWANKFVEWFQSATSDSQGEMSPRLWEQAVEEAQGFSAEALAGMGADFFGGWTVMGELAEDLREEMDGSAEDEHLLSALTFNVGVLNSATEAQLKHAVHILEIYFHMIDLKDPTNYGFITKEDFDNFVNTSLRVDANTYPPKLCRRAEPCRKFFLRATVSAKLFRREMRNVTDLSTFKMSEFQFLEMALQGSCKTDKLVTSFRRLLFLLLNPSIKYTLNEYEKWAAINHTSFDNFLSLHRVAGQAKKLFLQYFDSMTSDANGLLKLGDMEVAIDSARHASSCNDAK